MQSPNPVNLPEEIILDILYRLPAKSVGRCKCVSKPWRTLISHPNFIQIHLSLANKRPHRSVLLIHEGSLFVVEFSGKFPSGADDGSVSPVRLNILPTEVWYNAYCSFNGLVLARNSQSKLFVINPTTLEFKQLTTPYGENLYLNPILGFGYDSTTNDYKVVVISYPNIVYIYRFKSNDWEMLPGSDLDHGEAMAYDESGVALNNSLHWFGEIISWTFEKKLSESFITAFDLGDEKFLDVPLPSQFDRFESRFLSTLGVVCGCLCIVCQENSHEVNGRVDVWVMKEYSLESSWTKVTFYQEIGFDTPVYFWGKEEFVLMKGKAEVAICNVKEETSTNVVIRGIRRGRIAKVAAHCTFMDSLVSPKWLHQGVVLLSLGEGLSGL